jgi:hypothetical protein
MAFPVLQNGWGTPQKKNQLEIGAVQQQREITNRRFLPIGVAIKLALFRNMAPSSS